MEELLRDAEEAQRRMLRAVADGSEPASRLKDPVLLLLDVLGQCEAAEARRETLQVLRRVFAACSVHFHDAQAFLETPADTKASSNVKRGNVVLKALLRALSALSSQDPADDAAMQALVHMTRDLCLQSMSAIDVVALFDFLRLGRPPARRWVLQMQKELVEMDTLPRAIFTMRGANAGLVVPADQPLFSKRGYSCSFGVHLDASAPVVALYSFRGQNGQGVAAVLEGKSLVVKLFAGQGVVQQAEVPFADHIDKMERDWVHLCIVHAKKMVFKDKLAVYVDGKSVFNGNLAYPDPLMMARGQNSIGFGPLAHGVDGKIWSPTLFGVALSEAEVQRLHWLTHWKNDLNSVAAENAGLTDKSKLCFCYDARNCDLKQRICYDVSGNDCHGSMGPGTSAFVTQSFVHALDSVGGCACFLLLLLDQIPEMADFHPVHEFGMGEISDLLAFVGTGLRHSTVCRSHFVRLEGVKVVEFILQSISPSYLSVSLLDGVVSILEAMTDFMENDEEIMEYIYRLLFFNTSWFLSPFDTQVRLLGEVLPKYLQILQKASLRERGRLFDAGSPPSSAGKLVAARAASLSEFSRSLDAKDQVDVGFFCRVISQVYTLGASSDKEDVTTGQMEAAQLAQLRELVLQKLIDVLLFPPAPDAATDQWRQLVAYIFRQCEATTATRDDNVDIEEILRYLAQNMASTVPRKAAAGLPTRQLQLTTNMFKLSKGTVRVLWRPMLSANYNVRLAALRLFELYTSDKVLLHKRDMLMLYSSCQAHTLTGDVADLLLDIVIGRKRSPQGNSKSAAEGRTGSFARMTFIPLVLMGLIHNANFDVQAHVLREIRLQLASPTMGDSVKETIRSWPPWMSRLRSLALGAFVAAAASPSVEVESTRERSLTQSEELNEACALLSADFTSAFAKIEAIQVIAKSGDESGCDFALSLIQNRSQSEAVTNAIIDMVIKHFPQRWSELVRRLASQMIVDIVVYCILNVKNGWMHFLEFYFCHFRTPSDLCSLTAVICEQAVRRAGQKLSAPQSELVWENLSQVAAMVSQYSLVAAKMNEIHVDGVILSPGQQSILTRKAFELWQVVLPHLKRINWDGLMANLVQNADYGAGSTPEETAIFTHLVASRSRAIFLALQTSIRHVTLAQPSSSNDFELVQQFQNVLEVLNVIASLPVVTACQRSSGSLSSSMSPPVSESVLPDMALALPLSGITDSCKFFSGVQGHGSAPERELVHLYILDACFTILEASLRGTDIETVRLLVNIMVALANTALHLRDPSAKPELTKTLQIMSSTDLAFFSDLAQFRELFMLWKLHRETHQVCCDAVVFQGYVDRLNEDFIRRWTYVIENDTMAFNPFLIQQHANSEAEVLGNELQQCEALWKELTDEDEAAEAARASEQDVADESRLVELKHSTEKFASSVHKLLAHSSHQAVSPSLFGEDSLASATPDREHTHDIQVDEERRNGVDGIVLKIDSRENSYRMRLRLKRVTEEYRARNLSCEYPASSLTDTESRESGRRLSRRFRGSIEGNLADLEHSWRSDAGSDYNDFLADAQMRAAIIRSLSNPEEYESAYGDASDDDDLDMDDIEFYDAQEDDELSQVSTKLAASDHDETVAGAQPCTLASPIGIPGAAETSAVAASSPSSFSPVASLKASPPLSGLASVLTVVGGVADYFQKSVKDAKDVVEYGVDSLYTTKDAVSEEAQALMQEVSTYIDKTPGSHELPVEQDVESFELTPSSLKLMETKLAADRNDDGAPELFPSASSSRTGPQGLESASKRANGNSKADLVVSAQLVRHLHVVEGKLILSTSSLRFVAERVVDEHEAVVVEKKPGVPVDKVWRFLFKRRRWRINDIASMYRRRYLLKPTALEIFIQSTRKNYFFNLAMEDVVLFHEALMTRRPLLLKRDPSVRRLRHPSSLFRNSPMSNRWVEHEISTFEYLMWLNTIAGRTYNDLTQYPVFPWVISEYESATLDLTRRGAYRDLRKPMGALEPTRLKFYVDRYNAFEDPDIPKFMYGTHYSNIGAVLYYLIRLEPFTSYALSIQGGKFDHADRLFHSIAETWHNCLMDYTDLKELTPEWFYLPEFLVNCNGLELGTRQNGADVNDVVLPPWAHSPEDFVLTNLVALESDYVSANIHHWIDLVFGCKQRGAAAVEANNVFFYLTYEGMVDVDSITDPVVKSSMQSQIAHFGQTPTQVLREPHPQRRSLLAASGFSPSGDLNGTVLSVPHEAPIVLVRLIPTTSLLICVDSNGMLSCHRFGANLSKPYHQRSTKSKGVTSSSSSGGEPSSEFIELQDRKSRKVFGEKRLLSSEQTASNVVAFLNGGLVACTVGHHDFSARFHSTTDGALLYRLLQHQSVVTCVNTSNLSTMLALGCMDGTISVWQVASMNSTLLDSLKIFRGSKASSKPVHANDYSADQVLLGHNAQINCLSVSDEMGVCVSGSASNECLAHNLEDGSILHSYDVPGQLEPGVISLALSNVGHVVLQSMGTGLPVLYSFHLNGALLAQLSLGDRPMTSLSICARYSKVVVSNSSRALVLTAHTLHDQRLLLEQDTYGEISSQGLAPDEMHVVFGVGIGKIACLPLLPPQLPLHRTEM